MDKNLCCEHWVKWLAVQGWDWHANLSIERGRNTGTKTTLRRWIRKLEKETGDKLRFKITEEQGKHNVYYHILAKGINGQSPARWQTYWENMGGIGRVERYNQRLGNYYLGKYIEPSATHITKESLFTKKPKRAARIKVNTNGLLKRLDILERQLATQAEVGDIAM